MSSQSRVRVYIACSLDGFIAGVNDDLSWLPGNDSFEQGEDNPAASVKDEGVLSYEEFTADVGAMLMGRRTYDAVLGFDIGWPYGDKPVVVATSRPLDPIAPTILPASGTIEEIVTVAKEAAAGKDVYLDGGNLIRQGLDAGLVDELVVTMVPVAIGAGHSLFAGVAQRHHFELVSVGRYIEMLQMTLRPRS